MLFTAVDLQGCMWYILGVSSKSQHDILRSS